MLNDLAAFAHALPALQQMPAEVVEKLNPGEKELLSRLYVYGDSLRALAREKHIPVTTLQSRHKKLLQRLKKKLE